jgi:hypothetical protein
MMPGRWNVGRHLGLAFHLPWKSVHGVSIDLKAHHFANQPAKATSPIHRPSLRMPALMTRRLPFRTSSSRPQPVPPAPRSSQPLPAGGEGYVATQPGGANGWSNGQWPTLGTCCVAEVVRGQLLQRAALRSRALLVAKRRGRGRWRAGLAAGEGRRRTEKHHTFLHCSSAGNG